MVLNVEAGDILEQKVVNKKQQEDAVLKQIKEDYSFDEIKDAFDEGALPHQLDFFYGGENSNFNQTIEFSSPSNYNREFIPFLLFDQEQNLMTNNSLSIHIESGDIFYQNFNTGKNFYNFILAQQDDQTAPIPKRISYHHSFEKYIQNFLPSFSIDNVEKFDLYVHKNAKYLFYRFNDYIAMSGGKRQIIKHTLKVKDSIGLKKVEERDRQFFVQKIIHAVEFKNLYENSIDKKPEIIDTVENNYRIIRWVYKHLYADIADMLFEYILSLDPDEIQQLDDDIKTNEWGVINLLEIDNVLELLSTFQIFYHNNGILPVTNGLLIVPDHEVQEGQEKINLKNLFEMFRYMKSHGLVSM